MNKLRIRHLIPVFVLLAFTACEFGDPETAIDADATQRYELRGGATLIAAPGTTLDADELESRDGYGTTLTDLTDTMWFVRVVYTGADELEALGLDPFDSIYLGSVKGDGGDDCQVFIPLSPDSFVLASRPAAEHGCPESLDDVVDWLPTVIEHDESNSVLRAYGDKVGSFNGIDAFSNGTNDYYSGDYSCCGVKYQCVEYVNRYYFEHLSHKNLKMTGNASDYFWTANSKALNAYTNGATNVAPAVGDMLVSNYNTYGHIAIIREVGPDYVIVIHQNWSNTNKDDSKKLTLSLVNGKYKVGNFGIGDSYPVQGWLRKQ